MRLHLLEQFAETLSNNCSVTLIKFLALQVNGLPNGKELLKELKMAVSECESPSQMVLQSGLDILIETDLREQFASLNCPVSIIQGDKDTLVPVQASRDMFEKKPDSQLNILKGAGHVPFLSHRNHLLDVLNSFL